MSAAVDRGRVRDAVVAHADRWHRTLPAGHRVTSPLGAWLVLALVAPVTSGEDRDAVEAALGLPAAEARSAAAALLDAPPPPVAAAAACWTRPELLGGWEPTWPAAVGTGPVPSQAGADAWTREHTLGLLDRFPVDLSPATAFVLCSALATRVRWETPFELAAPFGDWTVPTLASPAHGGRGAVVATRVGDVAVWTTTSTDGLDVTSVLADRAVPPADVLAVAHEIAVAASAQPAELPGRRSLFDLPLGEGPLGEITERVADPFPRETHRAVLPAWEARSSHDLSPDPGFTAVGRTLASHLEDADHTAVQSALARFGREGFEAAAVTAVAARAVAAYEPRPVRTAVLRFGHPYAVVATAPADLASPWSGLPVFAAWVTEATDPDRVVTRAG